MFGPSTDAHIVQFPCGSIRHAKLVGQEEHRSEAITNKTVLLTVGIKKCLSDKDDAAVVSSISS